MSEPTTWQCRNCGEQHHESFDICWKCGTDTTGNQALDFRISEPVGEQDQAPDSTTNGTLSCDLQLPVVTYYSIPPYIWFLLVMMLGDLKHLAGSQAPDFSVSMIEIVVYCIATVLIGIPMSFAIMRALFHLLIRRQDLSSEFLWIPLWFLPMFQLPESIQNSQRWFVPVYYGSIATLMIAPLGFGLWLLVQMVWRSA